MNDVVPRIGEALLMAFGMFWKTGWSLVLGFFISAVLQAVISKERMRKALGRDGVREIALAAVLCATSSSCSYAWAAISRTLFKKGAALIPSLAFLFASTNLVIELDIILECALAQRRHGLEGQDAVAGVFGRAMLNGWCTVLQRARHKVLKSFPTKSVERKIREIHRPDMILISQFFPLHRA